MRGTTVVASNGGGLRDIVRHEQTGLLVPPSDVRQLSAALVRLASDSALCERMGGAGRVVALQEYTIGNCCDRLLALYEQVLAPSASATEH